MNKSNKQAVTSTTNNLNPFRVRQALVGLEMKQTDKKLLQYLNFLSGLIPVDAMAFIHQLPSYALYSHLFNENLQLAKQQEEQKQNLLRQMREKIGGHFQKRPSMLVTHEVRTGDPLAGLLQSAKEYNADLILVGQKMHEGGHGVLPRKLAGLLTSNALIIPQAARPSLNKILVPVDFSAFSQKALETAIRIRQQMHEKPDIICLHVFDMPEFATREAFRSLVREDKEKTLAGFTAPYVEKGYGPFGTVLLEKEFITRTGLYIMEYALMREVDLIVLGAKGLSLIDRMIMGSVTERLLSVNDDIPTMIVK